MQPFAINTETIDPAWQCFDQWPALQQAQRLWDAHTQAVADLNHVFQLIALAGEAAAQRLQQGQGRLIYAGAGSAGMLACLDGAELPGTFGWPHQRLAYLLAGGFESFFKDQGSAEDDTATGLGQLKQLQPNAHDVLIAVTASGTTPYTLAIAQAAKQYNTVIIGICNNALSPLETIADHCIVLSTGAEAIAGSTRLAAGSAQKIALNTLSTLIMARLGYVYDNLMVNMHITNQKLVGRAIYMISAITGCDTATAAQALEQAQQQLALAVLLVKLLSLEEAKQLLAQHNYQLRPALQALAVQ